MTVTEELAADQPWAGHAKAMDLYGRLVGTWDVTNHYLDEETDSWIDGTVVWTFGWVLAGHAVQDVMWFTAPGPDGLPVRVTGSTMRLYDPVAGCWNVVWFSPTGRISTLAGRPGDDGDIVQEGTRVADGRAVRWVFSEMTGSTFRWLGHVSSDGGATWQLEQEMRARRRD